MEALWKQYLFIVGLAVRKVQVDAEKSTGSEQGFRNSHVSNPSLPLEEKISKPSFLTIGSDPEIKVIQSGVILMESCLIGAYV